MRGEARLPAPLLLPASLQAHLIARRGLIAPCSLRSFAAVCWGRKQFESSRGKGRRNDGRKAPPEEQGEGRMKAISWRIDVHASSIHGGGGSAHLRFYQY